MGKNAKASYYFVGFSVETNAYEGRDYDITEEFNEKITDDYMEISIYNNIDSTSKLDFGALGANNRYPTYGNTYDCSGGHVYRLGRGDYINNVVNYVYENGYKYAGLKVQAVDDTYTVFRGIYKAN